VPDDGTEQGHIGARVAAERKLRGLTQRQLARRAHISYSLLTKVEAGHAPATPAFIGAVARALRVDVPEITAAVRSTLTPGQTAAGRVPYLRLFSVAAQRERLTLQLRAGYRVVWQDAGFVV
jgi:transcriptional regulator with XRE-family HTH domain